MNKKVQIFQKSQSKSDFFPIWKNDVTNFSNPNNFISSKLHLKKFSARSEKLFCTSKILLFFLSACYLRGFWTKKFKFFKNLNLNRIFFQFEKMTSRIFQIQIILSSLNLIWKNFEQDQRTFLSKKKCLLPKGILNKNFNSFKLNRIFFQFQNVLEKKPNYTYF